MQHQMKILLLLQDLEMMSFNRIYEIDSMVIQGSTIVDKNDTFSVSALRDCAQWIFKFIRTSSTSRKSNEDVRRQNKLEN